MPSVFAWKTLGTYIVTVHAITRKLIQAAGKNLEADLADVKSRLKKQEMETRKANAKFVSSIAAQEKLKTEFDAERKAWAEEKAALVTRAEQAEKTLFEKTAELSGLKRRCPKWLLQSSVSHPPAFIQFKILTPHNSPWSAACPAL